MKMDILASVRSDSSNDKARRNAISGRLLALSLVAASGAVLVSSCFALPLALALAGVGGTWLSNLPRLAPYKVYMLAVAVLPLAAGWNMATQTGAKAYTSEASRGGDRPKAWTYGALAISTMFVCLAPCLTS